VECVWLLVAKHGTIATKTRDDGNKTQDDGNKTRDDDDKTRDDDDKTRDNKEKHATIVTRCGMIEMREHRTAEREE